MTTGGREAAVPAIREYDLVVIGSGPAGQRGAIALAEAYKVAALNGLNKLRSP